MCLEFGRIHVHSSNNPRKNKIWEKQVRGSYKNIPRGHVFKYGEAIADRCNKHRL